MKKKSAPLIVLFFLVLAATSASAFYDPGTQRWLNRDPLAELGGINLYSFAANSPVEIFDPVGLSIWKCTRTTEGRVGRHAYLWDDRPGGGSCGMGATAGHKGKPTSNKKDKGPINPIPPFFPIPIIPPIQQPPWQDGDYQCIQLRNTYGREQEIMEYCRSCINEKVASYRPSKTDCHTACDAVLADLGIEAPPMLRTNPKEQRILMKILTW